jgi:hypothetical protein
MKEGWKERGEQDGGPHGRQDVQPCRKKLYYERIEDGDKWVKQGGQGTLKEE